MGKSPLFSHILTIGSNYGKRGGFTVEKNRYKDDDSIRVGLAGIRAFLVFALAALNAETISAITQDQRLSEAASIEGCLSFILTAAAFNISLLGKPCGPMYVQDGEYLSGEQYKRIHMMQEACLSLKCMNRVSLVMLLIQEIIGLYAGFVTGNENRFLHNNIFVCIQLIIFTAVLYGNAMIRFDERKNWIRSLLNAPNSRRGSARMAVLCTVSALWSLMFAVGTYTGTRFYLYIAAVCALFVTIGIWVPMSNIKWEKK